METMKKRRVKCIILNVFSGIFAILSILLGFLIYAKKDSNARFLKENFNINADFTSLNESISKALNSLFSFGLQDNKEIETVNANIQYLNLGENNYKTLDKSVCMIDDGIILGSYKEKNDTYSVIVSYENGVVDSYSNLSSINVMNYDKLKENDVIGSYYDSFKALFKKDGRLISINEIE